MFLQAVERFRATVDAIKKNPLPIELFLSIIQTESGGKIGAVNTKSGASGLMQVMPVALKDYNQRSGRTSTMEQMRSGELINARVQLEVGIWIFAKFVLLAYRDLSKRTSTMPIDDLIRFGLLYYVAGPGNIRAKLDRIKPISWASFKATYPEFPGTTYAETVFDRSVANGANYRAGEISSWIGQEPLIAKSKDPFEGFLLGASIIAVASMFFAKKKA